MTDLLDCTGSTLLVGDLVVYSRRRSRTLSYLSPIGIGWVVIAGSDRVLVGGVGFEVKGYEPRSIWTNGSRWMNPRNLRRMPQCYLQKLPREVQRGLEDIFQEQVL